MRYRKGSKVEVLNKQEVPCGSWRCAEVVCSNRYYITVKYDMGLTGEVKLENVARNLVRPRASPLEHPQNWIPGDVIEVLHNSSWKMAKVSKVLKENNFMARLVGSSTEFKVHKLNTRPRQSWFDEKWVLVGQGSGKHNDRKYNERSSLNYHWLSGSQGNGIKRNVNSSQENDYFKNEENIYFQKSCTISPKTLKRRSSHFSHDRTHEGIWKSRLIEKDGGYYPVTVRDIYSMPQNIHYGYTGKMVGQNEVCSLADNGKMLSGTREELIRIKFTFGKSCARMLEHDDPDTSSVGSCSIASTNPLHSRILAFPVDNADDHSSDAESACQFRNEEANCLLSSRKELAAEIHRLELQAYRCTMEALYASGPLSWEQESLITNLRISLHITNDEHLMELRSLISSGTSISIR